MTQGGERRGGGIFWFILGLAAVGLAVFLVVRDEAAREAVADIAIPMLIAVELFQLANVFTDSVRYRMVFPARFREVVPAWPWHRIFSVGRFLNGLVPQAGSAYRAAHLRMEFGIPVPAFLGSVLAISWLGNGIALILAGLTVLIAGSTATGTVVLLAGLAIIGVVGVGPRLVSGRARALRRLVPDRAARALRGMGESFVELAHTPGRLARVLAVSVSTQASGAAAYVLVCAALGLDQPLVAGVALYAGTTVATTAALTPGGFGIAELAAAAIGSAIDIGAAVGVLCALVIRLTGKLALGALALVSTLAAGRRAVRPPSVDS